MANTKSEYEDQYILADEFFTINNLDPDRKTIKISLPQPPPIETIQGYGQPREQQYFRKMEVPKKILQLEQDVMKELQDIKRENRQETVTGYKIIDGFWQRLEDESADYEDEIDYIKKVWWHRIYGQWFFNDGKPTYITGRHFMFMNFFTMVDVRENEGKPEYRDRHRREFLFRDYLRVAHHTFAKRDDKGWAIAEEDGHYEMKDMGMRLFYGDIHPKSRRNGSTIMSLSDMIEGAERGFGRYSTIISKDGDSTEEHYNLKLLPSWSARPFFLKPLWNGTSSPTQIKYFPPKNSFLSEGLMSVIDYTASAGIVKKDGSKLNGFVCMDEEGKVSDPSLNVLERWNVLKNSMALGDGTKIIGECSHISTVEEINAAGKAFIDMLELSDFYQRGDNGQTSAGLGAMFFPAYDGLEGFIDRFGMSVIHAPTERQLSLYPKAEFAILGKGAFQYQQEKRDDYIKQGTPAAMQSYRAYVKKYPHRSSELTIGTAGDMGWDYEALDKQMAELRKDRALGKLGVKIGNLYRKGDHPEGDVYWRTEENGKFEITYEPPPNLTNLKRRTMGYDVGQGKFVPQWEPIYKGKYTLGVDPVEYSNKKDATTPSKQSDPAMSMIRSHDKTIDKSENPEDWETEDCILFYRYRPQSIYEFCEDCLMAAEWIGAMIYPERNKTKVIEHIVQRGRMGYLKHDIDSITGKLAPEPGYYVSTNKSDGFGLVKDWVARHVHKCKIYRLLEEIRNIRSSDELTKYDGLASWIAALRGDQSPHGKLQDGISSQKVDLGACSWLNS